MFGVIKRIDDKLYQWDTGRKLFIDNTECLHFDEVHFSNKNSKTALVLVPYIDEENDGKLVVDIPNILLQESEILHVYLVESDMGEERTVYHTSFSVMRRNKPDDYIYTETEILNYTTLYKLITEVDERINNFVGFDDIPDAIKDFVNDTKDSIIDYAPDELNTIGKVANSLQENNKTLNKLNTTVTNKQDKQDNNLATTDKTIVGAINELNERITEVKNDIGEAETLLAAI